MVKVRVASMAEQEAQAGPAVDLRDEDAMRSTLFYMLIDWDGSDLKNVYEPISQQIGYIFAFFVFVLLAGLAWRKAKRWNRERRERPIPYRVIKPPSNVVTETEGEEKKRIVAVLGGTGFVGSHVVEELLSREECHVYLLGRRFGNVSEEVRSRVAALIQVDMMDYDGLVKAFQGVDSIVHAAIAAPTVFSTIDSIWRINKLGMDNVLAAAQASGVKQLVFVSGLMPQTPPKDPMLLSLTNCFQLMDKAVLAANGKEGLSTCVLAFSQIYGINNYYKMFLRGDMSHFPLLNNRTTPQPVEYTAKAILAVEEKLMEQSDKVTGKLLKIPGWPTTVAEFMSIPEWGHSPPRNMSFSFLYLLAKLNVFVATVTRWAPMGADMVPAIVSMVEFDEEEEDDSIMQEALGIGPAPDIHTGVKTLAEKYKKMTENKK